MIDLSNSNPEICVIGRLNFGLGIGAVCYSACELLSRSFPVSIYPVNSGPVGDFVNLPNGRRIPVCRDLSVPKVFFYTDVLWNGEHDLNYTLVPAHGLRIAHIAYDSDELPAKWVNILNNHFDVAYFTSGHLEEVARASGVQIAVGTLPCGLELEPLLTRAFRRNRGKVRFGSVAAFHQRKGVDLLTEAFLEEFAGQEDVELVLHSNLAIGEVHARITSEIERRQVTNVIVSHSDLSNDAKTTLVESIDIFVNCSRGEGYSIGPREALALGKSLVLSDIGPHRDMFGLTGTYDIPATVRLPARYPEINNEVYGLQRSVTVPAIRRKLREAYEAFEQNSSTSAVRHRRQRASEFAFHQLETDYAEVLVPHVREFHKAAKRSAYTRIGEECKAAAVAKLGAYGEQLRAVNRTIHPAYDGGFFSVFNSFMSNLVWDLQESRCHMVLPDWDVARLLKNMGKNPISFCYGRPEDGNVWVKLFEPLYGLSAEQMNSKKFLYDKATLPRTSFNERREPLLTYIHAYDLYRSGFFPGFRRQYNAALRQHVKLLPELQTEIDNFVRTRFPAKKFMLAAHVKHPSHIIEQPGAMIAHGESFIHAIQKRVAAEGYSADSPDWGVFLATDQDRVVQQFREAFGGKVCFFDDVRRTRIAEDEHYDTLSDTDKAKEGFQVQHLVAADPGQWNTRMAWEVIRDAFVLARVNVLFHVVSNVSTAVSYINPEVEMNFMNA
jgi:glycosyltransferase involved in cell wall biosynthesis